eukprot:TRINITY_DN549_c0_g1_i2.p1 TRINITY_DN549_c0_g1~~TRINITY_DN549_c0_g1_i2.p1  ORF type:complete len:490 (-),score=130.51 TRINITY_DN549_c0_g1_i2:991-2460(-)
MKMIALAVIALIGVCQAGTLWMPSFFQSGMVLQREPQMAVIHGNASANSLVQISMVRKDMPSKPVHLQVKTAADSLWEAQFPPQVKGGPATITIVSNGVTITLQDVLFGDVILCSGQSNMEFDVTGVFNYTTVEEPDSIRYPNMRLFQINHNPQLAPVDDVPIKGQFKWVAPSPKTLGDFNGNPWNSFSASCYYTGRELMRRDPSVPLGLLTTCFGGTSDRRWSSPEALKKCNITGSGSGYSDLWFGMIVPFLKLRFSGMLWYQGENDAGHPSEYACSFPTMIEDWRKHFNLPTVPFGFVELAGYPSADYSQIRLAQAQALNVEHVFMATAIDLGDPTSPFNSIHPRLKQEVGRRLSLGLEKEMYGVQQVIEGPKPSSVKLTSSNANSWTLDIVFSNAEQLHINGTSACSTCCNAGSPVDVQIQGNWVTIPATSLKFSKSTNSVFFTGSGAVPTAVRGMFGGYPQCAFYNAQKLASPTFFKTVSQMFFD